MLIKLLKKITPYKLKRFKSLKVYGERLKLFKKYSDEYYETIVECINKDTQEIDLSLLFKLFKKNSINYRYFDDKWWTNFIITASLTDTEGGKIQKSLIADIKKVSADLIDIRDFLHFYNVSLRFGLLNVGYHLREKAIKAAIYRVKDKSRLGKKDLYYGIPALFEKKDYSLLNNLFKRNNRVIKYSYPTLLNLLQNETNKNDVGDKTDEFDSFVRGKSIAIVGPAKTDKEDASEIDSYDVVVRCNYKEEGIGTDDVIKGNRCDISYFNGKQCLHFLSSDIQKFPDNVNWLVTKSESHKNLVKDKFDKEKINHCCKKFNVRCINGINKYLFNNGPNAIPNIAFDLLLFNPKKVKIFHADLMLTVQRNKGYDPDKSIKYNIKEKFLRSLSTSHDPISQFVFLKNLFDKNLIEGDKRFQEVMKLEVKQFMVELQNIYGDAGRVL